MTSKPVLLALLGVLALSAAARAECAYVESADPERGEWVVHFYDACEPFSDVDRVGVAVRNPDAVIFPSYSVASGTRYLARRDLGAVVIRAANPYNRGAGYVLETPGSSRTVSSGYLDPSRLQEGRLLDESAAGSLKALAGL